MNRLENYFLIKPIVICIDKNVFIELVQPSFADAGLLNLNLSYLYIAIDNLRFEAHVECQGILVFREIHVPSAANNQ